MATKPATTFLSGFQIPATLTSAFVVSSSFSRVTISNARVVNSDTETRALTLQMVPSGASFLDRYQAIITKDIGPGQTVLLTEILSEPMQTGDAIWALGSAANVLSLTVGGTTFDA